MRNVISSSTGCSRAIRVEQSIVSRRIGSLELVSNGLGFLAPVDGRVEHFPCALDKRIDDSLAFGRILQPV
jgi:hypothetical protein